MKINIGKTWKEIEKEIMLNSNSEPEKEAALQMSFIEEYIKEMAESGISPVSAIFRVLGACEAATDAIHKCHERQEEAVPNCKLDPKAQLIYHGGYIAL